MPIRSTYSALALILCSPELAAAQTVADSGSFVVRRGRDTVATEQFTRTPIKVEGTLTLRNAKRTSERWSAVIAPDATVPLIEVTMREGSDSGWSAGENRSARSRNLQGGQRRSGCDGQTGASKPASFATERGAVPYLNLSFALLEQAVRRARVSPDTSQVAFFNLGGGQTLISKLSRIGTDSLAMNIGPVQLRLRVDSAGRVLGAWVPAQNVIVERR